mmetsp:Transcript_18073/g.37066  ORF Transcript_18073/g.37066 Transcript_18073/m.37066 type:complete len:411 (+) Transcript_18073:217-1449(+)
MVTGGGCGGGILRKAIQNRSEAPLLSRSLLPQGCGAATGASRAARLLLLAEQFQVRVPLVGLDRLAGRQLARRSALDGHGVVADVGVVARVEGLAGVPPPDDPFPAVHVRHGTLQGFLVGTRHAAGRLDESQPGKETGLDEDLRNVIARHDVGQVPRSNDGRRSRSIHRSVGGGRQWLLVGFHQWFLVAGLVFVFLVLVFGVGARRHAVRPERGNTRRRRRLRGLRRRNPEGGHEHVAPRLRGRFGVFLVFHLVEFLFQFPHGVFSVGTDAGNIEGRQKVEVLLVFLPREPSLRPKGFQPRFQVLQPGRRVELAAAATAAAPDAAAAVETPDARQERVFVFVVVVALRDAFHRSHEGGNGGTRIDGHAVRWFCSRLLYCESQMLCCPSFCFFQPFSGVGIRSCGGRSFIS